MKSSKEYREQLARREKVLQAEADTAIKAPPVETFFNTDSGIYIYEPLPGSEAKGAARA